MEAVLHTLEEKEGEIELMKEDSQAMLTTARKAYPRDCTVQHYKGPLYTVREHALDSAGVVDMVYSPVEYTTEEAPVYTRPFPRWSDLVHWNGETHPRFRVLEE